MESCCRVCSRSDEFRRFSLFAVAEVSQEVIANMIRDTSDTQVSSEDGLPQHICPDCLMTLSLAYSFRKQCRRSDAKFREYWGGRTPSQSIDQQQQLLPRRSQSQAPDDGSFTAIKEEVDIYDYEYSVPSHQDNQWVIQNPRTIGEGAMTVVHNSGHYFDEPAASGSAAHDGAGGDRDGSSAMPMVTAHLDAGHHHDPAEMGESSGLAQKGDKLMKKKAPTPERYSQRIRRQEVSTAASSNAVPRSSEPEWSKFSVSVIPEASLVSTSEKPAATQNTGQMRCEHCNKKMKKPYKHRNGKCLDTKTKSSSRPKCAYCHQTFVNSKGIPGHLRNSCRIYRQVCEAKGIVIPPIFSPQPSDHSSTPTASPVVNESPELNVDSPTVQGIHFEQKPKMKRAARTATNKWNNTRFSCQYCSKKFVKKANLIRHQQRQCEILLQMHDEKQINAIKPTTTTTTTVTAAAVATVSVPLPLRHESQDDKSAIVKDQLSALDKLLPEEETQCDYCQQKVNKKTRFLHHNGRCVLGRVNADYPCPDCPEAFTSRSLLQKHRCQQPMPEDQSEPKNVETSAVPSEPQPRERKQRKPSKLALKPVTREKTPIRENSRKRRNKELEISPKSIVKREFCSYCRQRIKEADRQKHKEKRCFNNNEPTYNCGYCRKGFGARDSLIEHQKVCTVRKQHKQVKCQFCGSMISNRGNLRKHQKVYCKSVKREGDVKPEKPPVVKPDKSSAVKPDKLPAGKPKKPDKPRVMKLNKPSVVKKEEKPIKKKKKMKKEVPEEDVENIPLKQRKIKPSKANAITGKEDKPKKKRVKKERRFPCDNCKLTFATEGRARKHGIKCSAKAATKCFACKYCAKQFTNKSNMYRHQRILCRKVDPKEDIVNETIKEFSEPKTIETSHSKIAEKKDEEQLCSVPASEPSPTPTEDPLFEDPNKPAPCAEQSQPESEAESPPTEPNRTESTEAEAPRTEPSQTKSSDVPSTEPSRPEAMLEEEPCRTETPMSEDDNGEGDDGDEAGDVCHDNDDDDDDEFLGIPEPEAEEEEEEVIVPEEHLPMEKEEVVLADDNDEDNDGDDSHVERPHNNNAEVEKSPTEAVRLPSVAAPVIERNEVSQQHDDQLLSTDPEVVPVSEPEREPMEVEHSVD